MVHDGNIVDHFLFVYFVFTTQWVLIHCLSEINTILMIHNVRFPER